MKQSGRRIAAVVLALVLAAGLLGCGSAAGEGCRGDGGLQDQPDPSHDGQGTHGLRGLHHFVPGGCPRG